MAGYAALGVPESGTYQYLVHIDDGGYANRLLIRRDCNKYLAIYIQISNSTVARLSSVAKLTNGSAYRLAFSWSSSGFSVSLNSGACVTAPTTTTTTLPSGLTTCRIGSDVTGASQWGGHGSAQDLPDHFLNQLRCLGTFPLLCLCGAAPDQRRGGTVQQDPQGPSHPRACVQKRGGSQSGSWSFYRQVQP